MGVHLLVLPFKMGIYRKRNVHQIGSSLASAWAQETGTSSSVPLNQDTGHYTQDLMITPRTT